MGSFSNPFSRKTVSFLRSLKRHNDREWFRARRDQYDAHVRLPIIAVIEQLAHDLQHDDDLRAKVEGMKRDLLANPALGIWWTGVW